MNGKMELTRVIHRKVVDMNASSQSVVVNEDEVERIISFIFT